MKISRLNDEQLRMIRFINAIINSLEAIKSEVRDNLIAPEDTLEEVKALMDSIEIVK